MQISCGPPEGVYILIANMDAAGVYSQNTFATDQVDQVAVTSYQSVNGQDHALGQRSVRT